MERVEDLIHKLSEQQKQNAGPDALLATVQELYTELLKLRPQQNARPGNKISVVMPGGSFQTPSRNEPVTGSADYTPPTREPQPAPAKPDQPSAVKKPESKIEPGSPSFPEPQKPGAIPVDEVPTLAQHGPPKELHEVIADKKESLNEKLNPGHTEVVHSLKDSPIKDLRKGIAVNDKFVFINDLFRGDEAMYERSIKTINSFQILQEAEYWMKRELNVKLGWNENSEVVKHFYQVVRRRFL